MKTKLYKMWIEFCNSQKYISMMDESLDPDKEYVSGKVLFSYKASPMKATYPSAQYNAWRAFRNALDPDTVVKFLCLNFDVFKDDFPLACVFLDLHNLKPEDMIKNESKCFADEFKIALSNDMREREMKRKHV